MKKGRTERFGLSFFNSTTGDVPSPQGFAMLRAGLAVIER
jgi:hypothetical protein